MNLKEVCKKVVSFTEEIFTPCTLAAILIGTAIGGILGIILGILLITAEWYSEHE